MPKRTDIESILVIGAGPILIGQAAEFDYSGTQAVKALKNEGYRVILVNSNPATIMTDPEFADATYIEPITPDMLRLIIKQERPDALLPTVGGQTGINAAVALAEDGTLEALGVDLLGARLRSLQVAEDRLLFKETMEAHGLECPTAGLASSLEEAHAIATEIGSFPILIRPSFTLGGSGGGIVYDVAEFEEKVGWGLDQSPVGTVLIEESVIGWKEFELEVMRDRADNFVVVCSIENIDPMGVHTGDSMTVAPAMTLTDREYQRLRDQAKAVMRAVGVETGGSNVQFAVNPADGRVLVIEMNPRVSRSSALASKATGFPIAKIAALLAVGYTLDEIPNTITKTTMAAFEPSIDYVVTKLPRWAFEKFPGTDVELGPQMKSVGEAMSIGRTFKESLLKGLASLELGRPPYPTAPFEGTLDDLRTPLEGRLFEVWAALQAGHSVEALHTVTGIDRWWLAQLAEVVSLEKALDEFKAVGDVPPAMLRRAKRWGFTDGHIGHLVGSDEASVRAERIAAGIVPTYHVVDTCAAEFESYTPYLYSSYERESEAPPTTTPKVIILGNGPNRIGQGIEFDYACVHAAFTAREMGYEAIMVNCNPETVSTDYDTSDRLYFEPLTAEHVLNVIERETDGNADLLEGVVVQFGGQTPLKLAAALEAAGVPILGTSTDAIDRAEERGRFGAMLAQLDIPYPAGGTASSLEEAKGVAKRIGYPVVVRPSYVLGGRAMAIIYSEPLLERYMGEAFKAAAGQTVLIDQYLEDAYEVDVDAIGDGENVVIGGVLQHIEEAGVHSGDSAMVMPPYKVSLWHLNAIRDYTEQIGRELGVVGLMNIQFAVKDDVVYVLEVNPRASRTVPFVSKATGVPLAKLATRVALGDRLADIGLVEEPPVEGFFVKEVVIPLDKFPGADAALGPEMRSTGEVMGHAGRFGHAFAKAQIGAGNAIPAEGTVLVSVNDFDKSAALKLARDMQRMGLAIIATRGTANFFIGAGLRDVATVNKVSEGTPNVVDYISEGRIDLIISTPLGQTARDDGQLIRRAAIRHKVPLLTTLSAAQAAVGAIRATRERAFRVRSLQAHHNV